MSFSCSTIGFAMLPLEPALGRIAALGFDDVEIGVLGSFCPHLDPCSPAEAVAEECLRLCSAHGVRVTALNTAPRLYCDDSHDSEQLVSAGTRLLRLAALLGCDLVTDAGERTGGAGGRRAAAAVAATIFRLGREEHGVRVQVEIPHRGSTTETVAEAIEFLDVAGEPDLGIVYDTSHATNGGFSAAEGLASLGSRVARIHARDHRGDDIHLTPGDGEYEWEALAAFQRRTPAPVCIELEFDGRLDADGVAAEARRARSFLQRRLGAPG